MNTGAYTDPLASLFRPNEKPRFASLDWPVWDGNIFDRDVQALENGPELAFIAGTTYVRRAVSLERPKDLPDLFDRATLNVLGRWGFTGFIIEKQRVLESIEGKVSLLGSFRSGVLFAIEKLRELQLPEHVNKGDVEELVDALEAHAHGHFVAMAELGPSIAEAQRVENVVTRLGAIEMAEESGTDEDEKHSEEGPSLEYEPQNYYREKGKDSEEETEKTGEVADESARDNTCQSMGKGGGECDYDDGSRNSETPKRIEGRADSKDG